MRLATFGLFVLILGTGAVVETAYQVRQRMPGARFTWSMFHGRFQGPSHSFDQPAKSVPLTQGTAVEIANTFGNVKVTTGTAAEARVVLRTVVYEENAQQAASLAQQIYVVTEATPAGLRIGTNRDQVEAAQVGPRQAGIETHLDIQLPAGTPTRVRNEHGDAAAWDLASLDLENAFGTVDVQRVAGDARVSNRHGDSKVADVKGGLTLEGRHGDAEALRTGGAVKIDVEHGDVRVVESGALALRMAHGEATVEKVNGELELQGEHTALTATGVTGGATVRTSYRDVELRDVTRDVRVESGHGAIVLARVGGSAKVETHHDRIELTDVTGLSEVDVENGDVEGHNLIGGATIRAKHDAVTIDGFAGPIQIVGEQSTVDLSSSVAPTQPISVRTTHDEVRLSVPSGSALEIETSASHGEVSVDLPGFTTTLREPHHLSGRVGNNGPRVSIEAENGSIHVKTGTSAAR